MPSYTVELTYIVCIGIEADDEQHAADLILNDEELPLPLHSTANVTKVNLNDD
jgi:hypothetical protein